MKKQLATLGLIACLSVVGSMVAFAGQWQQTDNQWKYQNDDGGYAVGWQWIDGNKDGIAECYYLGTNGVMLSNTTTPDGYTVNQDGAWVLDNKIQTKSISSNNGQSNTNRWNGFFYREAYTYMYADPWRGDESEVSKQQPSLSIRLADDKVFIVRNYSDTIAPTRDEVTLTFSNEEKTQAYQPIYVYPGWHGADTDEGNGIYVGNEVYTLTDSGVEISYVPAVDSKNQDLINKSIEFRLEIHGGLYIRDTVGQEAQNWEKTLKEESKAAETSNDSKQKPDETHEQKELSPEEMDKLHEDFQAEIDRKNAEEAQRILDQYMGK